MFSLMNGQKGFTLIEIMVVLVILGILATISVPAYTKYVRKAKISEAISNVGTYGTAIRINRMEKGKWPLEAKAAGEQAPDFDDIDVNEKFFGISWPVTDKANPLIITVATGVDFDFDEEGTFTYTINPITYKGEWADAPTYELLKKYAPYLLPTAP